MGVQSLSALASHSVCHVLVSAAFEEPLISQLIADGY